MEEGENFFLVRWISKAKAARKEEKKIQKRELPGLYAVVAF